MEIKQGLAEYKPITITLETKEEATLFWDMVVGLSSENIRQMRVTISNAFSTELSIPKC